MAKQYQSHKAQEKKSSDIDDICPICKNSLSINDEYTQRVGLIDENEMLIGWMCPSCEATFDRNDKLTGLKGYLGLGEA